LNRLTHGSRPQQLSTVTETPITCRIFLHFYFFLINQGTKISNILNAFK
jgi:hypothetical protein